MSKPEFYECTLKTDDIGNMSMIGKYNIAGELAYEISRRKESLWKHFCKDVCEQVLTDMCGKIDLMDFRNVFNAAFEAKTKEWKEENETTQ